jgi:sugar phosphate isomerase/epimerase
VSDARAISLAALTVLEVPPPKMVEIAAQCGYSHVGLRPIAATPHEIHFPLLNDLSLQRETLASLRDNGVGVLDIEIFRLKPETNVGDFEAALAFGSQCGARFVLVAGNDPDQGRLSEKFAQLGELCLGFNLRPQIEFMPWTDVADLASATALLNASSSSNVGILVDAFHLNRSNSQVRDIPQNDPRFGYVQLCDIGGPIPESMEDILHEARAARLFPGQGDCPLIELLGRVPANTPISLEVPADALRAKGMTAFARAEAALTATRTLLASWEGAQI